MTQLQVALLFLTVICVCSASITMGLNFTCKEAERKALLVFKHSFTYDPLSLLGSWVGHDCCSWKGIECDKITGNVIKLDLGGLRYNISMEIWDDIYSPDLYYYYPKKLGAREVTPTLLELKYLKYLDLSFIQFNPSTFPDFFGSMTQLQHLNLSFTSSFTGKLPCNLGNLTHLISLDVRDVACVWCKVEGKHIEWAFKLEKLKYLDLSGIDLSLELDSLNILYKLPSLSVLNMDGCNLGNSHQLTTNSNISSTLLQHLHLGNNLFSGPIPRFIQNLSSLEYLNLRSNKFNGSFPSFIQKLSFLTSLDLSNNKFTFSIPSWLANNTYLEVLSLSGNEFNHVDGGIMNIIGRLCRLRGLSLSYNQLQEGVLVSNDNISSCSIYDLEFLDMSNNKISGSLSIISSFSSLKIVDLSHNSFETIPQHLGKLSSLYSMDLSYNKFSFIPPTIGNLSSLNFLDLSHNHLETLPPSLGTISSLFEMYLSYNNLSVLFPSIGNLSSLGTLDLSHNRFETIPPTLGKLNVLNYLDMSYNNLNILFPSIGNLSSLSFLDVSHNHLETVPPSLGRLSLLHHLDLSHNNLGAVHQVSLGNLSSLTYLDISSNSIILDLFPKWVLSLRNLNELDLSDGGIFGALPDNIGSALPDLTSLRLANNHINGSIPRSVCGLKLLGVLDIQKNRLSGMIPDCWENSKIIGLELSSNRLSGHIPISLALLSTLQLLSLNNNLLEGELPLQLNNSTQLTILDVGRNNLDGEIPLWNGAKYPFLQIVILRENRLNGTIPRQLCSFRALQIIDLAKNNLVGIIPACFGNFPMMGSVQQSSNVIANPPSTSTNLAEEPAVSPDEWSAVESIKGAEREYTSVLHLLVNIDLSCNNLVGVIPSQISNLNYLVGLNLSHNHLNGTIPKEIGKMTSLESLDLSFNNLSGSIPESLSSLDSLSSLNFSFNNLHGQIPTSPHLTTLNDSSIYMGNSGLCGDPLPSCFPTPIAHAPTNMVDEEQNKHEKMWLYFIIMSGFATGFWGIIGTLVLNKKWRHVYYGIAVELAHWIYVKAAVRIARANRTGR